MSFDSQIIYLVGLLALSGFFSASEIALVSLSRHKVRQMLEKKKLGAEYIKSLKDDPQRMISTILIGNNLANVAASAMATSMAISLFQNNGIGIATGVMTFLILVFGEITPKTIASQHNQTVSSLVAAPLWYMSVILSPLLKVLNAIIVGITNIFGLTGKKQLVTEEDVMGILKEAEEEGTVDAAEKMMIRKIFEFDDITAGEIMTPKEYMFSVSSDSTVEDMLKLARKNHYSRIPVYEGSNENIVGIVLVRDAIRLLGKKAMKMRISRIMKKPYFVPEGKKIGNLLRRFQKRKEHMAVVVNEHGSVSGIVTIEDVLEEIVGEIMDETDRVDPDIRQLNKKSWLVKGKASIAEVKEKIGMNRLESGGYETFAGFLQHYTGRIPNEGEEIKHGRYTFTIEERIGNRIAKVTASRR
ncbi:HlyC/CorC family transporter [Candidatus Woesearchaeota archaeon]|nr:HlyC/CorC family transporter [Candidatus Woesearchaeota archaeon]